MRIDLSKLIEERKLDKKALACVLFPNNNFPSMALQRVLQRETCLDEQQIYRLSVYCQLSIDALYSESMYWKQSSSNGLVRFSLDNYNAIYSPTTGITKIYDLESLFSTTLMSQNTLTLSEYLNTLNTIINNQKVKS